MNDQTPSRPDDTDETDHTDPAEQTLPIAGMTSLAPPPPVPADTVQQSAVANAEANHELIGDELKVAEAYADEGPTLKRYRPRAMGRATRIRKRTSHLTITLAPAANESKERSR